MTGDNGPGADRLLDWRWVDAHDTSEGVRCPVWGPVGDELDSPVCGCGHELTRDGVPLPVVAPLELQGRIRMPEPMPTPVRCPFWADLEVTERVTDGWGRSALHVRILGPRNRDGTPVTQGPVSSRDLGAWLGPSYPAAAAAADTIAAAVMRRPGRLNTWPLEQPARDDVRAWLLDQWRHHATAEECASELG